MSFGQFCVFPKNTMNVVIYFALLISLVACEDLSQGREGTNLEIGNGFSFNSQIDTNGKPAGSVFGHVGGKLSQVQPSPSTFYYQSDPNAIASSPSAGLTRFASVSYFAAGVAAALSIWYICALAIGAAHKKTEEFTDLKSSDPPAAEAPATESKKTRRRRSTRKSDDDMTNLASLVLAAVQSGECLQKSICLMGAQVSGRKGRVADTLLSTLLPTKIQQSDYYSILRKSLRGEVNCEKYRCMH